MAMMRTLFHSMLSALVSALTMMVAVGLVGCGAISHSATDTNTNWLSACNEDAECGSELACLCGACTIACESDGQCQERDQSSQTSQCSSNAACGAAAVCVSSEPSPADDQTATPSSVAPSSVAPSSMAPDELTCGRPRADYEYIGEGCPLDFDCWSFTDECGCGCLPAECQTGDRLYVATSPGVCLVATFACRVQETPFSDECGCGCQYNEVLAPECDLPDRRYLTIGPGSCAGIGFVEGVCEGGTFFENECGCGCILPSTEPGCDETERERLEAELQAEWINVAACTSDEQCEMQYNAMCGAETETLEFVGCSQPINREADQERLREVEGALSACEVFVADCDCAPGTVAICVDGACRAPE